MGTLKSVANVLGLAVFVMGLGELASTKARHPDTLEFFFPDHDDPNYKNASAITWAHAVNSRSALKKELKGTKQMLEADVSMGTVGDSSEVIPIMAHPPNKTSDLSLESFLDAVIKASTHTHHVKRGIKLDFKDIEAVEPSLKMLRKKKHELNFPVWLNADVLVGPGNPNDKPVDGNRFLNLTQHYTPSLPLSLGWTTAYECESPAKYESNHIEEMNKLIHAHHIHAPLTFPVRAGLAVMSGDEMLNLVGSHHKATLTLWSAKDDAVNATAIEELITVVGARKVYIDLPFKLSEGSPKTCGQSDSSQEVDEVKHDRSNVDDSSHSNFNVDDFRHKHDDVDDVDHDKPTVINGSHSKPHSGNATHEKPKSNDDSHHHPSADIDNQHEPNDDDVDYRRNDTDTNGPKPIVSGAVLLRSSVLAAVLLSIFAVWRWN